MQLPRKMESAGILIQNDFVPGGALAVPAGDAVVPVINRLAARFDHVVVTQDWHPAGHPTCGGRAASLYAP